MRISANGETAKSLIKDKSGMAAMPQILPDGKSLLYTAGSFEQPKVMVQSLKSGEAKELFAGAIARYLPTGQIVYQLTYNNTLFAIPFDIDRQEVKGEPVPIVDGVVIRRTMTRLTFEETTDTYPLWTRDSKRIAFCSIGKGKNSIYWKAADGTGRDELLVSLTDGVLFPSSWSGDDKSLVNEEVMGVDSAVLVSNCCGCDRKARDRSMPTLVPVRRWWKLASVHHYLRPETDARRFHFDPIPWMYTRSIFHRVKSDSSEPTFKPGTPTKLFQGMYYTRLGHQWDLSRDRKRFLMIKQEPAGGSPTPDVPPRINVVLNWTEELKQRVSTK